MTKALASKAPPFCPNPACPFHLRDRQTWRYEKIGFFDRQSPPYLVQRYRCLTCRRSFSDQTFAATYWMRRADLLAQVFLRTQSCSGFRQIAREFGVSPTTIAGISSRIGRHCLLFHELHRPKGPIREPLALDDWREGFVVLQSEKLPRLKLPCRIPRLHNHFHDLRRQTPHFDHARNQRRV